MMERAGTLAGVRTSSGPAGWGRRGIVDLGHRAQDSLTAPALAVGAALATLLLDPRVKAHPRATRRGTTALLLLGTAATPSIALAAVALLAALLLLAAGLLRGRRRGGGGAAR
jgi:hypothetical protein